MPVHNVFICYSRKDEEHRDRFVCHLDPHQRFDQLSLWYDKRMGAGDRWKEEIFRAIDQATAAVVLVSPDLLASRFVIEEELPRLFRAASDRDLLLTSLFLRPSSFDVAKIEVDGKPWSLADFQGLNDPAQPLKPGSDGDAMLKGAVDELIRALADRPVEDRRDRPRKEIHVELDRRGGKIFRSFGQPPFFDSMRSQGPYPGRRLAALDPSDEAYGRLLFEVLLGDREEQLRVLSKALQREIRSPDRYAFRVRILCHDDALRQLPWSLCRTRQDALVDLGWSFELALDDGPRELCHLPSPSRALFVAAEVDGPPKLDVANHERAFEGLLQRAWGMPLRGSLLRQASTRRAVKEAIEQEPRLIYVYAHAREGASGCELLLGDGGSVEPLPLAELAEWLVPHPPQVLVLNTPEDVPPAPAFRRPAACLHLRGVSDLWRARQHALDWWQAVLLLDHDPARAFCALPTEARRRGILTTDYRRWQHEHSDYTPKVDRARAHLDRRDQRRVVREAVEELVRSPRRRVTCLVAYGAEGTLVGHFALQLAATLKIQAHDVARLVPHGLWLPKEREELTRARIRDAFREGTNLQPLDGIDVAFDRAARGPKAKPVQFFNWGTYPSRDGPGLRSPHLESWIDFCRDELAGGCPETGRAVAYLGLVTAEENHARLERWLGSLAARYDSPRFTLVPVPALGVVEALDLLHFLMDEHNSSCPEDLRRSLPARIVAETGGSFETTVDLLEKTERANRWYELDEELPEAEAPAVTGEDFPL